MYVVNEKGERRVHHLLTKTIAYELTRVRRILLPLWFSCVYLLLHVLTRKRGVTPEHIVDTLHVD